MPPIMPWRAPRSPSVSSRPPAKRRIVRGSASRKAAIVRRASGAGTGSKAAEGGARRGGGEGRAGARVEEVRRPLVRGQGRELRGRLGALPERLAHADDPAAADL